MKCSLCDGEIEPHPTPEGVVFWRQGHNAQPVNDGRCCGSCNSLVVIPARLAEYMHSKEEIKK